MLGEKMRKKDFCVECAPTKEQIKQDASIAFGADLPEGWPKPPTITPSGFDSDDAA
jgi:hypothetical protein